MLLLVLGFILVVLVVVLIATRDLLPVGRPGHRFLLLANNGLHLLFHLEPLFFRYLLLSSPFLHALVILHRWCRPPTHVALPFFLFPCSLPPRNILWAPSCMVCWHAILDGLSSHPQPFPKLFTLLRPPFACPPLISSSGRHPVPTKCLGR